jgi:hypothetical protein
MEQTLEHRIRQRAYEIWHAHGRADGKANEHWLAAEHEVLASLRTHAPASDAGPGKSARRSQAGSRSVGQRSAKSGKTSAVERSKS